MTDVVTNDGNIIAVDIDIYQDAVWLTNIDDQSGTLLTPEQAIQLGDQLKNAAARIKRSNRKSQGRA